MKLRTLGALCLEGSDFRQSRPLLLLAYLCLEGAQDRRHLAELFWPTSKNALSNLTTVLSRLNKLDNSLVKVEGQKLHSNLSCDATELLDSFEQENYLKITEHHQARFLNGFYLKGIGEELEEWLYATRESLANKVRYARIVQAEQKARHGMLGEAAKDAAQIYSQAGTTDLTESDLEGIYTLLLVGGSPLAQTVKKEAESYGLSLNDTQEEIQQYFASKEVTQQTLKNKTEVAKPHNLPAQLNSFIGREQELQELQEQLSQKDTRLVTLLGTGGMGKTRLSLKLAEKLYDIDLFSDGVYFVSLASLNSFELVPQSVAYALGLTIAGPQPIEEQIINQVKDLELLVVLDNFEHVLSSTPFVIKLLESSPQLTLLVTSRERLQIPAEWVYNLWGLSKAEEATDSKPFKDAIRLFEQRAKQINPSFNLDNDYEHVLNICKSVEGMPLGIELAASWANTISTKDIALELKVLS